RLGNGSLGSVVGGQLEDGAVGLAARHGSPPRRCERPENSGDFRGDLMPATPGICRDLYAFRAHPGTATKLQMRPFYRGFCAVGAAAV
ncbi:MAG TPA: hypothetical protein VFP43_02835, partial [Mesorhizobium sp.]|nr:hypothetical protein [Mesorhizobium sp.]